MEALINYLKVSVSILLFCGLCVAFSSRPVAADLFVNGPGLSCNGASAQSAVCQEHATSDNPLTGCPGNCGHGILDKIANIVAYIAGTAAIILIIVGAIRFVTSGSDTSVGNRIDDDVLNAKRTITHALIGLAIIILAKTIINYVISKLG